MSIRTGSLSKSVKTCHERSTFAIPIISFLNIYFQYFSVKSYLILYAKQSKSGSESSVSCLKQGSEMRNFCLKQSRGLRASAAQLPPEFPWVPTSRWVHLCNAGGHMGYPLGVRFTKVWLKSFSVDRHKRQSAKPSARPLIQTSAGPTLRVFKHLRTNTRRRNGFLLPLVKRNYGQQRIF